MSATAVSAATKQRSRAGYKPDSNKAGPFVYFMAILLVCVTLGPVSFAILGGFRTNAQIAESPAGLPSPWVFSNYARVLTDSGFWQYALNSTVVALLTVVMVVVFGMMAAYPLARFNFKHREKIYMIFVAGLLFPASVAIIPLFILITRDLQMGNTWLGLALPQAAFQLPMTIVILRPFLQAIPKEIEEAATLDGAGRIGFFGRMVLPLSGPGMVTTGVLAFVASWNSYLLPLLLVRDNMKTLPLGVADFSTQYSSDTAGVFAFTTLSMIPALIFFLSMQNKIVNGLQGAVKG